MQLSQVSMSLTQWGRASRLFAQARRQHSFCTADHNRKSRRTSDETEKMADIVSAEDFKRFEEQYLAETTKGEVSPGTQFNYAWCLIKSPDKSHNHKGVSLLQGLCHSGTDQRDYLYFLAEGSFKINEYQLALKYVNRLLQIEPANRQGLELQEKINKKMKEDALAGLGILGGGALLFGGIAAVAGLFLAKRK